MPQVTSACVPEYKQKTVWMKRLPPREHFHLCLELERKADEERIKRNKEARKIEPVKLNWNVYEEIGIYIVNNRALGRTMTV